MPPTLNNPLTPAEYLLFNDMVTRIRTLEQIATQHFFKGDSDRRADIVSRVKLRVTHAHRILFPVPPPVVGPSVGIPVSVAPDSVGRCNFPYCPSSSGTCELCDLEQIQQQLLAALGRIQ